jgi:hypothetical protein
MLTWSPDSSSRSARTALGYCPVCACWSRHAQAIRWQADPDRRDSVQSWLAAAAGGAGCLRLAAGRRKHRRTIL